ncbi:MAG: hypothetical protein L0K44_09820, partial [Yaniella sp.]|nr:hypothetical protein [Yaniella sp.]
MTDRQDSADKQPTRHVSRRGLLLGTGGFIGGGLVGAAATYAAAPTRAAIAPDAIQPAVTVSPGIANTKVTVSEPYGTQKLPYYGPRQAGV